MYSMGIKKICEKLLLITLLTLAWLQNPAQNPHTNSSCYCIEEANAQPNILYRYDVDQQDWIKLAAIRYKNKTDKLAETIEAMALDPIRKIIYAFDGEVFGKIVLGTNDFIEINDQLSGTGVIKGSTIPNYALTDIDGLAYNPYTRELWATHRLNGNGINDILFKINPETGEVIKNAFLNDKDFVEVQESTDNTFGGDVYDVDGIAINPFTDQMFALQNQSEPGVITEINKYDGNTEREIFDLTQDDIEGLGFSGYGVLYGTTGDSSDVASSLIEIDFVNFQVQELNPIDLGINGTGIGDFESFDCISDYVDLALDARTKYTGQTQYNAGDNIDIDVNVHNQGTIEIDKFEITLYLPTGMTILSNGWTNTGNRKYRRNINNQTLYANTNYTFPVKIRLDNNISQSGSIPFEISKAENVSINLTQEDISISLPDIDSTPDNINQEVNIVNNDIYNNGKFENEDEDDHDVATFNDNCPEIVVVTNVNQAVYSALSCLDTSGNVNVASGSSVDFFAGFEISIEAGFEVKTGASFFAAIQPCQ